jgi:hypothetical protein
MPDLGKNPIIRNQSRRDDMFIKKMPLMRTQRCSEHKPQLLRSLSHMREVFLREGVTDEGQSGKAIFTW